MRLTEADAFHLTLSDEIKKRSCKDNDATQPRAVLVFFRDNDQMKQYMESEYFDNTTVEILKEELDEREKTNIIQKAANSHSITFSTAVFGRGTDFICRDNKVQANGGAHVIQAYFSTWYSEEMQIKGRTARQGQAGSFSWVIQEEELEQVDIDVRTFTGLKHAEKYDRMHHKRSAFFAKQYAEETDNVNALVADHGVANQFIKDLLAGKPEDVKTFIVQKNQGAAVDCVSKTICLLDATGSMGHLLQKAKNTIGQR